MFDPIIYGYENGFEALAEKLETMSLEDLKALIKEFYLDPFKYYSRSKNIKNIRVQILATVEARVTKGDCFRYHKG